MDTNTNKKISLRLIIGSTALLFYSLIAKEYNPFQNKNVYHLAENKMDVPISYYFIKILGLEFPFLWALFVSLGLLAIGIYWYLKKEDENVKRDIKSITSRLSSVTEKSRIGLTKVFNKGITSRNKKIRKKYIIVSVGVLILMALVVFLMKYYKDLYQSKIPLTGSQSIFMGFIDVAWKVLLVTIIISVVSALIGKKK